MAGMAGFEPTNVAVKVRCLTAWLHPYKNNALAKTTNAQFGVDNRIRTDGLQGHNLAL